MNPYPHGQCTWGAAEMCPCLQNTGKYGNFGNGGDWYNHAKSINLPTSVTPQVGWLASFSVSGWPEGPGDVGLIVAVNNDGTITRYGTNWHLDGTWSTDKINAGLIIGCFKPPCDCTGANHTVFTGNQGSGSQTNCMTWKWQWNLLGKDIDICFDPLVGMLATGGGMLLMAIGVVIIIMGTDARRLTVKQEQEKPPDKQQSTTEDQTQTQQDQPMSTQEHDEILARARQRAQARRAQQPPKRRRVNKVTGTRLSTSVEGGAIPVE